MHHGIGNYLCLSQALLSFGFHQQSRKLTLPTNPPITDFTLTSSSANCLLSGFFLFFLYIYKRRRPQPAAADLSKWPLEETNYVSNSRAPVLLGWRLISQFVPKPPTKSVCNHATYRTCTCDVHSLFRVCGISTGRRNVLFQDPTMISMMWSSSFRSDLQLELELRAVGP